MTTEVMGNFEFRPNVFARIGDHVPPHVHDFDHVTFCPQGKIEVTLADPLLDEHMQVIPGRYIHERTFILTVGGRVFVPAKKYHSIKALAPNSVAECMFSCRNPQGEVVEYFTGYPGTH